MYIFWIRGTHTHTEGISQYTTAGQIILFLHLIYTFSLKHSETGVMTSSPPLSLPSTPSPHPHPPPSPPPPPPPLSPHGPISLSSSPPSSRWLYLPVFYGRSFASQEGQPGVPREAQIRVTGDPLEAACLPRTLIADTTRAVDPPTHTHVSRAAQRKPALQSVRSRVTA